MQRTSKIFLPSLALFALLGTSSLATAESAGQYVDDAAITAKVKSAILSSSQLKSTDISVETNAGSVMLSGTVMSKDQESEAVRVANQVKGVKAVKDMLAVRGTEEE